MDWAIKTIWTLLTDWHNKAFARKFLQSNYTQSYDLVFCTAFSDFPLGSAKLIANKLHIPLICDIRDLDEQVVNSTYQYRHQQWWLMTFRRLYRTIHIRRRNNVLREADAITTVSPWHADFIKQFNANTHIVYNGFDEKQFYPKNIQTNTFTITYIGSLFEWQNDGLHKVQQAITNLQLPITLDFHTPQSNPIPFDQLGDTIRKSCIMLVFTSPNTHGMLTTKFYEALGCEKPVLCVPSDNGDLAELIAHTNAGIATNDINQIQAFIQEKYDEWKNKGFTHQVTSHREKFSRETQCEHMKTIIDQLL